jgi:transcriptional repressor NrdR
MICPKCPHSDTKVIESRDVGEGYVIRRRRECLGCDHRFTTYERIERPNLTIVKKDGTRQMFDRAKLMAGVSRATEKTSVTAMQVEDIVTAIEEELYARGESELQSRDIGELVMEKLAPISDVAYVRFASVYRSFKDIESFEKALKNIKAKGGSETQAE